MHELVAGNGGRDWHFIFVLTNPDHGENLAASASSGSVAVTARKNLGLSFHMGYLYIQPPHASPARLFCFISTNWMTLGSFP
jgi:hypothetical protein